MGGVDRADQILWTLLPCHKTVKWWIKVFLYLLEVSMVNVGIIYQAFHENDRSKRSPTPFCENIIAGLLSGYPREVRRPGKHASLPAPLRIVEQQHSLRPFAGKNKRNVGDCIVCSDRNKKRFRSMHECKQCRKPISCTLALRSTNTLMDFKVSCTGKDMHSGPASSSYDDPDPSLPSSSRSSSPSSES